MISLWVYLGGSHLVVLPDKIGCKSKAHTTRYCGRRGRPCLGSILEWGLNSLPVHGINEEFPLVFLGRLRRVRERLPI